MSDYCSQTFSILLIPKLDCFIVGATKVLAALTYSSPNEIDVVSYLIRRVTAREERICQQNYALTLLSKVIGVQSSQKTTGGTLIKKNFY